MIDRVIPWLREVLDTSSSPIFVGIDGRSGGGKSTLAAQVCDGFGTDVATAIGGDEFYAGGSAESWDDRTVHEKVAHCIDWRRQLDVLTQLRESGKARWRAFDWESADWDNEPAPLRAGEIETTVLPLVVLEGVYSCRPELHGVLDVLILVDPPQAVRRAQLLSREGDAYRADWEDRWSAAEDHYFANVMPRSRFDLIIE